VTERTDSATYRCEVVNKFGKVRSECRLVVVQCMYHLSLSLFVTDIISQLLRFIKLMYTVTGKKRPPKHVKVTL